LDGQPRLKDRKFVCGGKDHGGSINKRPITRFFVTGQKKTRSIDTFELSECEPLDESKLVATGKRQRVAGGRWACVEKEEGIVENSAYQWKG